MGDDELISLAQHRFDQADRADASYDDCQQLRDIFPAVLARLKAKAEEMRDLTRISRLD